MYPVLFTVGPFMISSFGLMMVLAFLIGNYLLKKDISESGFDPMIGEDITFRAAIGGIIGAKIYYLLENISNGIAAENFNGLLDVFKGIFTFNIGLIGAGIQNFGSGLVFLGGLIGGMFAVTLYIKKQKLNGFQVTDWVAPYLVLGHGIGRVGCFLVGDCYGIPSDLPWACTFPNGLPPTDISVHPTQLYEMSAYFIIFVYLKFIKNKKHFNGEIFFEYLFLAGIVRFLIEFIRTNPKYIIGLSGAQYISLIMIIVSIYFMWKMRKDDVLEYSEVN